MLVAMTITTTLIPSKQQHYRKEAVTPAAVQLPTRHHKPQAFRQLAAHSAYSKTHGELHLRLCSRNNYSVNHNL